MACDLEAKYSFPPHIDLGQCFIPAAAAERNLEQKEYMKTRQDQRKWVVSCRLSLDSVRILHRTNKVSVILKETNAMTILRGQIWRIRYHPEVWERMPLLFFIFSSSKYNEQPLEFQVFDLRYAYLEKDNKGNNNKKERRGNHHIMLEVTIHSCCLTLIYLQ